MTAQDRERRNERIRARLAEGATCKLIATELGLSLSVVSSVAIRAGHRSRSGPRTKYDWAAIRVYYENGHTVRECRERFGFSAGAWSQAINRGDIVPRDRRDPIKHSHATRAAVATLLEDGLSQADVARTLAISKATVSFHVRNLGIAPDPRFSRRYDWERIQLVYDSGLSARECCERFGCSRASWSDAVRRGDLRPRSRREPLTELLTTGRRRSRYHVKTRLVEEGLKARRCERCGLTEWRGAAITLELHHLHGDPLDNRLENLQLLCPNCHSQTENFGRRNARRHARATPSP